MNTIVRNSFLQSASLSQGNFFSWLRLSTAVVRLRRMAAFFIIFTIILCGNAIRSQAQSSAPVKKQQVQPQVSSPAKKVSPAVAAPSNPVQQVSTATQAEGVAVSKETKITSIQVPAQNAADKQNPAAKASASNQMLVAQPAGVVGTPHTDNGTTPKEN